MSSHLTIQVIAAFTLFFIFPGFVFSVDLNRICVTAKGEKCFEVIGCVLYILPLKNLELKLRRATNSHEVGLFVFLLNHFLLHSCFLLQALE